MNVALSLSQQRDDDKLILDVIPPPELHLLLGCVNTLYGSMDKLYPDIATKWAQQSNIERSYTNGGKFSFAGNACNALLNNVNKLKFINIVEFSGFAKLTVEA
ncbi:unnamed protein product [Brassicogethes aeneus]|uniref:Uncharacterized protein n=1 Tax=Brassicogethes aeneus TaxID=1431903 RepID=A0A9P0BCC1_BRAAE|nr:unnamed protein product [Brassicogethes aeneus]